MIIFINTVKCVSRFTCFKIRSVCSQYLDYTDEVDVIYHFFRKFTTIKSLDYDIIKVPKNVNAENCKFPLCKCKMVCFL